VLTIVDVNAELAKLKIDLFPGWAEGINRLAALLPTNDVSPNIDGASPQGAQETGPVGRGRLTAAGRGRRCATRGLRAAHAQHHQCRLNC
jgi:hypothetical protein